MPAAFPVPVVIDHCGGVRAAADTAHRQCTTLMRLLDPGHVWVKTRGYRASSTAPP